MGGMRRAVGRELISASLGAWKVMPMKKRQFARAACYAACCALSVVLAASLGGCAAASAASSSDAASASDVAVTSAAGGTATTDDLSAYDLEYSKRDLDASYDATQATYVTLADNASSAETYTHESANGMSISGNDVTITQAGTYVLKGRLTDGCVYVNIDKEEKCQLVLNGVSMSNSDGPCIYVMAADKTFITLAEGTQNTLVDGSDYVFNEEEPTATIFSKDDLTLNGTGSLSITGNYRHAVRSKDDLVITGGAYVINAVEDALNGKDCLKICDGTFDITCGEDALKSTNDSEEGRGFVAIDGGDFTISAGDDAVHAETLMRITAGTVDVLTCYEGYEGAVVRIDGGTTSIISSDDGINAASGSSLEGGMPMGGGRGGAGGPDAGAGAGDAPAGAGAAPGDATAAVPGDSDAGAALGDAPGAFEAVGAGASTCKVVVTGGTMYVSAGGDGIDSNGSVEVSGGVLIVEGPTSNADSFFDYDSSATITGGTVLMVGSTGMAQSFTGGTQAFAMASASGSAGQTVILQDAQGNQVASFIATKSFQVVLASADGAAEGDTLTVGIGSTETGLTASATATTSGFGAGGAGGGMGGGPGGGMGGGRGGNRS